MLLKCTAVNNTIVRDDGVGGRGSRWGGCVWIQGGYYAIVNSRRETEKWREIIMDTISSRNDADNDQCTFGLGECVRVGMMGGGGRRGGGCVCSRHSQKRHTAT